MLNLFSKYIKKSNNIYSNTESKLNTKKIYFTALSIYFDEVKKKLMKIKLS